MGGATAGVVNGVIAGAGAGAAAAMQWYEGCEEEHKGEEKNSGERKEL
jgi:hypothetical protein